MSVGGQIQNLKSKVQNHEALTYGVLEQTNAADWARVVLRALHFTGTAEESEAWLRRIGLESLRAVKRGDEVVAGLRIIPMGQWYGGVSVPVAGIAVVGSAPEHRSGGVSSFMMSRMLEEVHESGCPLALPYPATVPFYRRAGFERAGSFISYELSTRFIHAREHGPEMVLAKLEDQDEIHAVYRERAKLSSGNMDRPPEMWGRVLEPKGKQAIPYLIKDGSRTVGYVIYTQGGQHEPIQIIDYAVLTREAGLRLLAFMRDHRSLVETIHWNGGPNDPLLHLHAEQDYKITRSLDWMLRILNLEKALAMRGYRASMTVGLNLEVTDELLPGNHGRFVLDVNEGQGTVRRGGDGSLQITIRGLAALYTGHLSPYELGTLGHVSGLERDLDRAGIIFGGPRPWMAEIF